MLQGAGGRGGRAVCASLAIRQAARAAPLQAGRLGRPPAAAHVRQQGSPLQRGRADAPEVGLILGRGGLPGAVGEHGGSALHRPQRAARTGTHTPAAHCIALDWIGLDAGGAWDSASRAWLPAGAAAAAKSYAVGPGGGGRCGERCRALGAVGSAAAHNKCPPLTWRMSRAWPSSSSRGRTAPGWGCGPCAARAGPAA